MNEGVKSRYLAKYEALLEPAEHRDQNNKILTVVWVFVELAILSMLFFYEKYAWLICVLTVLWVICLLWLFKGTVKNRKEMEKYRRIVCNVRESIDELVLTEEEIETMDAILEDMENGIVSFKTENLPPYPNQEEPYIQSVTFTQQLMFGQYKVNDMMYIEMCRAKEVSMIKSIFEKDDCGASWFFDFRDGENTIFNIDIEGEYNCEGKQKLMQLLEQYYPNIPIVEETKQP